MLDQPPHVQERVLTLTREREPGRHLGNETRHPITHTHRRRIRNERCFHPLPPRTMTADTDTVRRERRGPFNQLTKSY